MKKIRITESQLERLAKMNLSEGDMSMDEFDYQRMHHDDDLQMLRDAIDKNKMVSVAFVKKDGTVKHMLIRKNLSSYVPSDREKSDAQMNVEMNNDIKKVVDMNAYKREISYLRNNNPEMGDEEVKMMAAKKSWRSINLKNVLGFMASGQFFDLRDENDILGRYGEEVNNSLTRAMINSLNVQEPNVEDDVAPEEMNENRKVGVDISRMRTMMGLLNEAEAYDSAYTNEEEEDDFDDGDGFDMEDAIDDAEMMNDAAKDEYVWDDMPELPEKIQANRMKGTTSADEWLDYILMKLDYKRDNDYGRTKKMFMSMDEKSRTLFEQLVNWKENVLYDKLFHEVRGVGDDGFSDLIADIMSRGTEFYNKVMENPSIAQEMVDNDDYSESFSYTFNED